MRNIPKKPAAIIINILIFVFLVSGTTVVVRPLQKTIREQMLTLRDYLINMGEEYFNIKIEYASMGPSIFGILDLREIRIRDNNTENTDLAFSEEDPFISISRLRFSFSLIRLLQGDMENALKVISLDKPLVNIYPEKAQTYRELMAKLGSLGEKGGIKFNSAENETEKTWSLPRLMSIRIRQGRCAIRAGESSIALQGLNFDGHIRDNRLSLRGKWTAFLSINYLMVKNFAIGFAGRLSGDYDLENQTGNITLNIPSSSGEFFNIQAVSFNVILDKEKLDIKKIRDHAPYELALNYIFATRKLSGEFRADNFSPREMLILSGSMRDYNRYLALSTTGTAAFETGGEGGISYEVRLSGNLDRNFPLGKLGYSISGTGNEKHVYFNQVTLGFPRGTFRYIGDLAFSPLAPNGALTISDFSMTGDGIVNGEFSVTSAGREISIFSSDLYLGDVQLSALDAELIRSPRGNLDFALSALRFRNLESYEEVKLSEISLKGTFYNHPRELQAALVFDDISAGDILDMIRPFRSIGELPAMVSGIIADTSMTTEVFITTDFTQVSYNIPNLVVAYQGGVGSLSALVSISGTDQQFQINEGSIVLSRGGIDFLGSANFSNPAAIRFSVQAAYENLSYNVDGFIENQHTVSITGSYGVTATAFLTSEGIIIGSIIADNVPIPVNGEIAQVSLHLNGRYHSLDDWSGALEKLEIVNLSTPASGNTSIRLSGSADQNGAYFPELVYDDGRGALRGYGDFLWDIYGTDYSGKVVVEAGKETCYLTGNYRYNSLFLTVNGENMQLSRVFRNAHGAVVTAAIGANWTSTENWSLKVNLLSLTARNGDNEIKVAARGDMDNDELIIQNLQMNYGRLHADIPWLMVNRKDALGQVEGRINGTFLSRNLNCTFTAGSAFKPVSSWFNIQETLDAFKGIIRIEHIKFDAIENAEPFTVDIARSDAGFSLSGGPENMIRSTLADNGDFYASLSYPSPVRGTVTGVLSSQTIDAKGSNLYVDLVSLWRYIPHHEVISCTGGFVNASVEIRGPLGDPEFYGTAQGSSVRLKIPQFLGAEIGPTPVFITLEGNEMHFGPLIVRCGRGFGQVAGNFRFDRWIPDIFTIDITVPNDTPIPFSLDIMGVVAAGDASGTLTVGMENRTLNVKGNIIGDNTEITLNAEEISSGIYRTSQLPNFPVVTDFSIKTGRKVDFYWPNSNTPILRASAAAGTGLRITSDSVSGRFSVEGDVDLRSGEIYYFQRSFYIRSGVLSFNENEIQFNPRLTIRAEIRDRTDDGPLIISLIMDNQFLFSSYEESPENSFEVRLESNPPLSQNDIFYLLGQNLSGSEENGGINTLLTTGADLVSQFVVVRRLERVIRDFLRLDMLSFRTQFLPNLVSRGVSGLMGTPVDTLGSVGNYFDNTSVFVGKYFGSDMFVQGMVLVRYNDLLNVQRGLIRTTSGLTIGQYTLEPDIGIELYSPLFDIRWNLAPLHVENLFVSDMSISLIWKWTI